MTLVRLEPAAPRSRVKHATTEPLRSLNMLAVISVMLNILPLSDYQSLNVINGWHTITVNSEIFARILFSRIALKDRFATCKIRD